MRRIGTAIARHRTALCALVLLVFVLGCGCIKSDEQWMTLIGDKKLVTASNSGSSSSSSEIYFCPNGEYAWVFEGSVFSPGGGGTLSSASRSVESGTWTVSGGSVVLKPKDGATMTLPISQGDDPDVITLGNAKYLIETHNECK